MNALAHHQVGQGDSRGQDSHAHFATLWVGTLLFDHMKRIGPAVVRDDDARVLHGLLSR